MVPALQAFAVPYSWHPDYQAAVTAGGISNDRRPQPMDDSEADDKARRALATGRRMCL